MPFINVTEPIGQILSAGTIGVTGDILGTLYVLLMFVIVIALMFGIPMEFLSLLILPLCISIAAFYGNFFIPVVIILIYISMLVAKNWLFR